MPMNQEQAVADGVIKAQLAAASMPEGRGYGYARNDDDPNLLPAWRDVLLANFQRSRRQFVPVLK